MFVGVLYWSSAWTMNWKATPGATALGAVMAKWVAAPALTVTGLLVPVAAVVIESLAVMVWVGPERRMMLVNVPTPLVSVPGLGNVALGSPVDKLTVPGYVTSVKPPESKAVTTTVIGVVGSPALTVVGLATTVKWSIAPGTLVTVKMTLCWVAPPT